MKEKVLNGKRIRRVLSFVLCLAMCLSLMPMTAKAATYTTSDTVALKDLSVGDVINGGMTLTNKAIKNGTEVNAANCTIYWCVSADQTYTQGEKTPIVYSTTVSSQTVRVPEKYEHIESWTIRKLVSLEYIENRAIVVYPTNHPAHNFLYSAKSADTIMASCTATGCPLKTSPTFTLVAEDVEISSAETYTATLSNWDEFVNDTDAKSKPSIQYNMVVSGTIGASTTGNYIIEHAGKYCASVTFEGVTIRSYFKVTIPPSECSHNNTEIQGKIDATCVEKGYTGDIYCEDCGTMLSTGSVIEATGSHNFVVSDDDSSNHICSVCGATEVHTFTEYISDGNATCGANGTKTAKCNYCDATDTKEDEGSATGNHDFSESEYIQVTGNMHKQQCKDCDAYSTPESCKDSLIPVAKVDASCEETGNIAYFKCSKCDAYYADADATEIIADHESVVIPAKKHSLSKVDKVDAKCTTAGCKEYWKCTNDGCGKIFADKDGNTETTLLDLAIVAKGHTWNADYTVDVEATTTTEGSKSIHCADCDAIKEGSTVTIPKKETVTPTASPIGTPEVTETASPSMTPEATATVAPSNTPEATATVAPSNMPEATATVAPSNTPEATEAASPSETPSVTSDTKVLKPVKVTIVSAKNNKKKTITIKIKAAKNAKKYKVQYALDKKFKKVKSVTTKNLTIILKKLAKKKIYYIRICGVNGKVTGPWSSVKKVKVKK